ncbi:TPA: hydroxymethylglutaryl-CoA reductase, degradative [Candidatus Micrarchaeota archaeon]|nr:hydroxymethylglutaryl-CoA reductase, degradative [Candidatus Micrarchaeota archaeon]
MSEFSGFYKLSIEEKLRLLKEKCGLTDEETSILRKEGSLGLGVATNMIENVIGTHGLPLGIATNFVINGKEYVVPFAIEEASVVAAASYGAKLAKESNGGFTTDSDPPIMIGQIQIVGVPSIKEAQKKISQKKTELIAYANTVDPMVMVKFGGGLRDIETREIDTPNGKMLVIHLLVDCRDAMGANAVNTLAETLAPQFAELSGGKVRLKIISNLAIHRKARAKAVWKKEVLEQSTKGLMKGEDVVDGIIDAWAFAAGDPFRAATHNKGIMNGIDAVVMATGNDWRAVEAGAHAFAAITGSYKPLTKYYKDKNGDLVGEIELPVAVGLVGGATKVHPTAKIAVKLLGVKNTQELAQVIAAVGLSQNFAALRALSSEGIQRGHMRLHARNIATQAGAISAVELEAVVNALVENKKFNVDFAKETIKKLRGD